MAAIPAFSMATVSIPEPNKSPTICSGLPLADPVFEAASSSNPFNAFLLKSSKRLKLPHLVSDAGI